MSKRLEERRLCEIKKRHDEKKGFMGREKLLAVRPGSRPKKTKKSDRFTHRPRVLSKCDERRALGRRFYFGNLCEYLKCSKKYRDGILEIVFPLGMFRPYIKPAMLVPV